MKRCLICFAALALTAQASAQQPVQPTEAHQVLAQEAGTWDVDVKMYFQGPEGPTTESKAVETNELVCGGLYSKSSYRGKMRDQDFEGHGLTGYDPRTKEYVGTWVDNFTAIPTPIKGTYDAETKTLTMFGTLVDVNSGQEMKTKLVTTFVDPTTKTFVNYLIVDAGGQTLELKLMETTAKKRE